MMIVNGCEDLYQGMPSGMPHKAKGIAPSGARCQGARVRQELAARS
jgi:hypothetical protein